jgi:hypothetical protein
VHDFLVALMYSILFFADSEEVQISPRILPSSSNESSPNQEPLSLVIRPELQEQKSTPTTAVPMRHWKKCLKDQASPPLPCQLEDQPENLCLADNNKQLPVTTTTTTTQVAQALLSLQNAPPRITSDFHHQRVPFRPLPIQLVPTRPLNLLPPSNSCRLFNSPPVWTSRFASDPEPENLQIIKTEMIENHPKPVVVEPLRGIQLPQHPIQPFALKERHLHQHPVQAFVLKERHQNSDSSLTSSNKSKRKPYHCGECKKSFATQSGHAKHLQLHCTNQIAKSFSCKFCAKGYTSLSALKMHIRTHTLPCKCDICGKSFSRPWLLQGHVRTHTGEKPFGCTYCTRSFADKSNLRAHLQTHLQTKKYQCPGCQKTFSRMSLLNKHTEGGCQGLQTRNDECVQTLIGLSSGNLLRA